MSGQTTSYSNWSPVEPNNPLTQDPGSIPEFYVHMWNPTDFFAGTWNNYVDLPTLFDFPINGVVEVVPVPEPHALVSAMIAAAAFSAPSTSRPFFGNAAAGRQAGDDAIMAASFAHANGGSD